MASGGGKFELLGLWLVLPLSISFQLCTALSSAVRSTWLSEVSFAVWETECTGGAKYGLIFIHSFLSQNVLCAHIMPCIEALERWVLHSLCLQWTNTWQGRDVNKHVVAVKEIRTATKTCTGWSETVVSSPSWVRRHLVGSLCSLVQGPVIITPVCGSMQLDLSDRKASGLSAKEL